MSWLSTVLKRSEGVPEAWYTVRRSDFIQNYGRSILKLYNQSPSLLLRSVYPYAEWLPWRFGHAPRGLWDDRQVHKSFMTWLAKELNFKNPEDWYRLTYDEVCNYGGGSL